MGASAYPVLSAVSWRWVPTPPASEEPSTGRLPWGAHKTRRGRSRVLGEFSPPSPDAGERWASRRSWLGRRESLGFGRRRSTQTSTVQNGDRERPALYFAVGRPALACVCGAARPGLDTSFATGDGGRWGSRSEVKRRPLSVLVWHARCVYGPLTADPVPRQRPSHERRDPQRPPSTDPRTAGSPATPGGRPAKGAPSPTPAAGARAAIAPEIPRHSAVFGGANRIGTWELIRRTTPGRDAPRTRPPSCVRRRRVGARLRASQVNQRSRN